MAFRSLCGVGRRLNERHRTMAENSIRHRFNSKQNHLYDYSRRRDGRRGAIKAENRWLAET
jgi:hypothetical protein